MKRNLTSLAPTQPADASVSDIDTKFEAEIKAQRVFALLIAARECAPGNSAYNFEAGVLENAREALLDIALEEAGDLVDLTN